MPLSKWTGPRTAVFATGSASGALIWVSVVSTDDCRSINGRVRLRLLIQRIEAGPALAFHPTNLKLTLACGTHLHTNRPPLAGLSAKVAAVAIDRAGPPARAGRLAKDDFAVVALDVVVEGALFEVDVLERLRTIAIPVATDGPSVMLEAAFRERAVWDNYVELPGGWWARADGKR